MAIPQVEEEQRRKRPATIVPPPNGAAAAPARQPFAGREAAVGRLENKGPSVGDALRGAYTGVPRVIAGAVLEPPARLADTVRSGIASATGRELVRPNALESRATAIKSGGADDIGAFANSVGAATKRVLGAVPVGETRPAAPSAPAAPSPPAPKVGTPPMLQRPTLGQAAAALPGTVEVPRGTLASLRPAESNGGMARNLSGPTYLENAGGLLAMADERERRTQATLAQRAAEGKAALADIPNRNLREALGRTVESLGRKGGRLSKDEARLQASLTHQIASLAPVAPEKTPTVGDLNEQAARTDDNKAQARLADIQAATEQQNAETEARKQATLGQIMSSLTPEQQIVAMNGGDPRSPARSNFQIAVNEEADPLNPGGTLKTSYLIDPAGNVRPVAGVPSRSGGKPTLEAFAQAARQQGSKMTDEQLAAAFKERYGG